MRSWNFMTAQFLGSVTINRNKVKRTKFEQQSRFIYVTLQFKSFLRTWQTLKTLVYKPARALDDSTLKNRLKFWTLLGKHKGLKSLLNEHSYLLSVFKQDKYCVIRQWWCSRNPTGTCCLRLSAKSKLVQSWFCQTPAKYFLLQRVFSGFPILHHWWTSRLICTTITQKLKRLLMNNNIASFRIDFNPLWKLFLARREDEGGALGLLKKPRQTIMVHN